MACPELYVIGVGGTWHRVDVETDKNYIINVHPETFMLHLLRLLREWKIGKQNGTEKREQIHRCVKGENSFCLHFASATGWKLDLPHLISVFAVSSLKR